MLPCPPWTTPPDCVYVNKGHLYRTVHCAGQGNSTEVSVMCGFCMTLDKHQEEVVVGQCPFAVRASYDAEYYKVPKHSSELDSVVCGATSRTGPAVR